MTPEELERGLVSLIDESGLDGPVAARILYVLLDREAGGLEGIVDQAEIWGDLRGLSKALKARASRSKLSQIDHIRRRAVQLFAEELGLNSAELLADADSKEVFEGTDKAKKNSAGNKLRLANKYISEDEDSSSLEENAKVLAHLWLTDMRARGKQPLRYLRQAYRKSKTGGD